MLYFRLQLYYIIILNVKEGLSNACHVLYFDSIGITSFQHVYNAARFLGASQTIILNLWYNIYKSKHTCSSFHISMLRM